MFRIAKIFATCFIVAQVLSDEANDLDDVTQDKANHTAYLQEIIRSEKAWIESVKHHLLRRLGLNETVLPNITDGSELQAAKISVKKPALSDQPRITNSKLIVVQPKCESLSNEYLSRLRLNLRSAIANAEELESASVLLYKRGLQSNGSVDTCPEVTGALSDDAQRDSLRIDVYAETGRDSQNKIKRELLESTLVSFTAAKSVCFDVSESLGQWLRKRRRGDWKLLLEVSDLFRNHLKPKDIIEFGNCHDRVPSCKKSGPEKHTCFPVLHVWKYDNGARRAKRQATAIQSLYDTLKPTDCGDCHTCGLKSTELTLKGVRIGNWRLTEPQTALVGYCAGGCEEDNNETVDNPEASRCRPAMFKDVEISYLDDTKKDALLIKTTLSNFNVIKCHCT